MMKYLWRLYYMISPKPKTKHDALYRYARCHGDKIYKIPVSGMRLETSQGVPVLEVSNFNSVLTCVGFPNSATPTIYGIKPREGVREEVG